MLLSDPAVSAVPVEECEEPLVDLRTFPELRVDMRRQDPAGSWARLRHDLAVRLLSAQRMLPAGLRLLVIEGYRPAALQQSYFDDHCKDLRDAHPSWSAMDIAAEASKYVSPPGVAPHPCGAAVDLTLCSDDGEELDLGTAVNITPAASANACFFLADNVSGTARQWRGLLSSALTAVEFVNYPSEWWHWSHGDRYWAACTGAPFARYGRVDA